MAKLTIKSHDGAEIQHLNIRKRKDFRAAFTRLTGHKDHDNRRVLLHDSLGRLQSVTIRRLFDLIRSHNLPMTITLPRPARQAVAQEQNDNPAAAQPAQNHYNKYETTYPAQPQVSQTLTALPRLNRCWTNDLRRSIGILWES